MGPSPKPKPKPDPETARARARTETHTRPRHPDTRPRARRHSYEELNGGRVAATAAVSVHIGASLERRASSLQQAQQSRLLHHRIPVGTNGMSIALASINVSLASHASFVPYHTSPSGAHSDSSARSDTSSRSSSFDSADHGSISPTAPVHVSPAESSPPLPVESSPPLDGSLSPTAQVHFCPLKRPPLDLSDLSIFRPTPVKSSRVKSSQLKSSPLDVAGPNRHVPQWITARAVFSQSIVHSHRSPQQYTPWAG